MTDQNKAAPALSSLAGGAVTNDLARIGYEAFNRSKKWEWASRGCQIGWIDAVTAILAALSPEAPRGTSTATPGGWLIKDHADGWFWTPTKIAAVAALTEGHKVYSLSRGEYEGAPFTDTGAEERYITDAYELSPEAPAREGVNDNPLTFGMGALVVNTGKFGGDNAVFIARAKEPGEVGAYTGKSAFDRKTLQPGELVMIFPTAEQAQVVADALVGALTPRHEAPAREGVDIEDMRTRARYLRGYALKVSAAMYGGGKPSGIWNLNRAADLLDQAADALTPHHEAPASRLTDTLNAASAKVAENSERAAEIRANWTDGLEAPAEGEVTKQRDAAIRIAKCLHDTVESLIYGLPKYLNDTAQTDEENMIGKAWHVFDAAAYGLAALPEVEPVQDLHELPQSVHEAPAEGAGERADLITDLEALLDAEPVFVVDHPIKRAINALRARSSAPEAREGEAVAWMMRENSGFPWAFTNDAEDAQLAKADGFEARALYTHPSAPSADKLRTAVEALTEIADTDPDDGVSWFHERADQALVALSTPDALKEGA